MNKFNLEEESVFVIPVDRNSVRYIATPDFGDIYLLHSKIDHNTNVSLNTKRPNYKLGKALIKWINTYKKNDRKLIPK